MVPAAVVPSMNTAAINAELVRVGQSYTGQGAIVECGTWLGASMLHISDGIGDRAARFHCYDRFSLNADEVHKARQQGVQLEKGGTTDWIAHNTLPLMPAEHEVTLHPGELINAKWHGDPIEIFVLDAAKGNPHFEHVIDTFGPHWLPDARLCFLDAYYLQTRLNSDLQVDYLLSNFTSHKRVGSAAFV